VSSLSDRSLRTRGLVLNDLIHCIIAGFSYDPGSSDLDDEQPIWVRMHLGDYRRACRAAYHYGDPCRYCGVAHDKVAVGNCPGRKGGPV